MGIIGVVIRLIEVINLLTTVSPHDTPSGAVKKKRSQAWFP